MANTLLEFQVVADNFGQQIRYLDELCSIRVKLILTDFRINPRNFIILQLFFCVYCILKSSTSMDFLKLPSIHACVKALCFLFFNQT